MGEYLDQVPESLHGHIKAIVKASKLPDDEETMEKVARGWLEKKDAFEEEIERQNMEDIDVLPRDDERGALALTYSGSLVHIGPLVDGVRNCVYTSIGLRTDAPDSAQEENSRLAKDVAIDEIIDFESGPVKSTSKIFKIAVFKDDISPEEQEENLTQVMTQVEELMLGVNKTIMLDE
ncbi:MAG: hypothetical protein JW881_11445 [Spirochaetales bacterium]|nr:hypothetical protein [Spirochaetales bacterium]